MKSLVEESAGARVPVAEPGLPETAAPSILMVDDQPARLLTYEAVLSGMPIHCVRAHSGEEALQLLLKQSFALILLDVNMPGMDGFEVARHVRAHSRLGKMPIIFVTGERLNDLDRLKGYEVGAVDYIGVPIVPEILRSKVALLVELYHRRSQLEQMARSAAEARRPELIVEEGANPIQLRAVFDQSPDVQFVLRGERDAQGNLSSWRYVDANDSALRLYGRKREEVVGRTVAEAFPERAARAEMLCQRALLERERLHYETDYEGRQLLMRVFAVDDACVALTGTDITDRKRTEFALANSERRFQALLERCPVGVAQNRLDGRFQYVNAGFCDIVGYSPEELYGLTWQQITHPDDLAADMALAKRVLAGTLPSYTIEKRYIRKDGTFVWVSMFGNFIFDDERLPVQGVAVVVDITARKRADLERTEAERALRQDEERFRELANNIDAVVWTCDAHGQPSWFNNRWYEFAGIPLDQMVNEGWRSLVHPDHSERIVGHFRDCIQNGETWEETFPVRAKSGEYRWFLSRAVPIRGQDGTVLRWLGTNTDITAQRELQDALTDADRRKDEFLAMLAHELRNPVAPIVNVAQVLSLKVKDDPQSAGLVSIVQRQVGHLSRLLDDLLDVARITRGRIELRREILNINECVSVASETVESLLRTGQHRLEISRAPEELLVDADRVRITQCLTNLLNNAAKYSPSGTTIQVRTYASQGRAVIEVRDAGRGIAPDVLPKIFDLFAQDHRSLDRKAGGLGIGLSVCKRLVEMHGGSVAAHSDGIGRGATFTLFLPLVSSAASKPRPGNPAVMTPRRRVFVVDDNADAADSIALLLELSGHETRVVYGSEEALACCAAFAPHVVLLDIGLPGMDGYEVIRKLRDAGFTGQAIALSGYGQPEDRKKALRAGFDAHLVKPVELGTLEKALARAL
jgi:PAS domain S-box-containing protein